MNTLAMTLLAFLNSLSPLHLLVVGVVALLLFGNRLPEIARGLGRSFNEFKRGLREVGDDDDKDGPDKPDKIDPPGRSARDGGKSPTRDRESESSEIGAGKD